MDKLYKTISTPIAVASTWVKSERSKPKPQKQDFITVNAFGQTKTCTTNALGTCTVTLTPTSAGAWTATANFAGDSFFQPTTATMQVTVRKG